MSWEINHNITAPFNDENLLINGLTVIHQINPVTQASSAQIQSDWNQTNNTAIDYVKNKPTIPGKLSDLSDDNTHRLVTDEEKTIWNNKQANLGFTPENSANKGAANGYAGLGADGKVPASQLPVDNAVRRSFSFNDGATLGADYYSINTSITAITARNIATVEYSTDGTNFTVLNLSTGLPIAVNAGDLYWRITYTTGKTQGFLDITGTK